MMEYHISQQLSRNMMKLFFEHNSIKVDRGFKFKMMIGGCLKTFLIRHFAVIESCETGQKWMAIDFLEEHFVQQRHTIVNNLCNCLNLKKPEGAL